MPLGVSAATQQPITQYNVYSIALDIILYVVCTRGQSLTTEPAPICMLLKGIGSQAGYGGPPGVRGIASQF